MSYKIGFIGLGHMGMPMALNLLKADFTQKLYVYDLSASAVQKMVNEGAVATKNIAELAKECDVIFTMLQTSEQVSDVCLSDQGIFKNSNKNLLYIDCSSISIDASRMLHKKAKELKIRMLDAPVSGGVKGAAAATLTIMVGGDLNILNDAKVILHKLGKNIVHAGNAGNGQAAKICNNMILGISMIAVSEAFNLGKSLGLDPQKLFDVVSRGSGECWSLTKYCPYPDIIENVPANNNYTPGFTAEMMLKDLRLSQKAANSVDVATPMGATAMSLYSLFVNTQEEKNTQDFSAIIKFLDGADRIN